MTQEGAYGVRWAAFSCPLIVSPTVSLTDLIREERFTGAPECGWRMAASSGGGAVV